MARKGSKWSRRRSLRERIEQYAEPEPMSGCWIWVGHRDKSGYGQIEVWRNDQRRAARAHRVSYSVYRGEIPNEMQVCHRCDTPACVNPAHLFLGTALDNTRDSAQKGRRVFCPGERHGMAKLTAGTVLEIERLCRSGMPRPVIARQFALGASQVARIANHQTWRHLFTESQRG